ncbi:alkaline phosphatase family protein [bacterium]|nr:alkaline phosphatase family protein [bacterium]
MRRIIVILAVVLVVVALAVVFHGRRPDPVDDVRIPETSSRILIVGIDGLDWSRVNRLADEGRMPNVARMRSEGSSGTLHSIRPFVSPTIWTCIATGKTEAKHGISGFVVNAPNPSDASLSSSNMRKVKAIWQILSAAERSVGVIGWLVTYPADVVNGYLISSHVTLALSAKREARAPNQTDDWLSEGIYPEGLWSEVADNVYHEEDVSDAIIESFIATSMDRARQEEKVRTSSLAKFYAADMTSLTLARHFFETRPADFSAVYFRGSDITSHFFWRFMEPESWKRELSAEAIETFSPVVERYYALADSLLGELLDLVDDDTVVVLLSDHGFAGHRGYRGFEGDVAVGIEMHREDGIIFVSGPGIKRGGSIAGASVLDVTPTVLALAGLPVARDMDGRPLTEVMSSTFLERYPVVYIDSYEVGDAPDGDRTPVESPVDDEIKEMLRSLGYID